MTHTDTPLEDPAAFLSHLTPGQTREIARLANVMAGHVCGGGFSRFREEAEIEARYRALQAAAKGLPVSSQGWAAKMGALSALKRLRRIESREWHESQRLFTRDRTRADAFEPGSADEGLLALLSQAGEMPLLHSLALLVRDPRRRRVLVESYEKGRTLTEIGSLLGISFSRAQQLRDDAFGEIRRTLTALGLAVDHPGALLEALESVRRCRTCGQVRAPAGFPSPQAVSCQACREQARLRKNTRDRLSRKRRRLLAGADAGATRRGRPDRVCACCLRARAGSEFSHISYCSECDAACALTRRSRTETAWRGHSTDFLRACWQAARALGVCDEPSGPRTRAKALALPAWEVAANRPALEALFAQTLPHVPPEFRTAWADERGGRFRVKHWAAHVGRPVKTVYEWHRRLTKLAEQYLSENAPAR